MLHAPSAPPRVIGLSFANLKVETKDGEKEWEDAFKEAFDEPRTQGRAWWKEIMAQRKRDRDIALLGSKKRHERGSE